MAQADADLPERPDTAEQQEADRRYLERIYTGPRDAPLERFSSSWHFTPNDHARAVEIAKLHPAVAPYREGRWSVLGADQRCERRSESSPRQTVHVHVFCYTSNRMARVRIEDDRVTSVTEVGVHEYPETPHEMATAIKIARLHSDLVDTVSGMEGHAILRVPRTEREGLDERGGSDESDRSSSPRCMWVMFTESDDPKRQLPTLYAALVDLCSLRVLACGPTPCGEAAAAEQTKA